ncbi:MAG TPA: hypothetical protein VHE99_04135 [Gammaproteobacteria bacterium]|nr:hypothetical protein [Gammaproteobacteria bacterium]
MKIGLNSVKVMLISSAAAMCLTTTALATVGNPTESVLRNEQVQTVVKNNKGANAEKAWSHMSNEQKQKAKEQENKRLHKIGHNKEMEHQEGTGTGTGGTGTGTGETGNENSGTGQSNSQVAQ